MNKQNITLCHKVLFLIKLQLEKHKIHWTLCYIFWYWAAHK